MGEKLIGGPVADMLRRVSAGMALIAVLAGCTTRAADDNAPRTIPYDRSTTAFVDVSVVTMVDDRVLEHRTVVVDDGRILHVGPASEVDVPKGATVIDGRNRWLMPGLCDMHVHVSGEWELRRYLTGGVTTIRNMAGRSWHLQMRDEIALGERLGPTLFTAGPLVDGDPPVWPGSEVLVDPSDARGIVTRSRTAGYDFVKMYSLLSPEAFGALANAAAAEHVPLVGHVPYHVGLEATLARRPASIEHGYGLSEYAEAEDSPFAGQWSPRRVFHAVPMDEARLAEAAGLVAESGVYSCPTAIIFRYWVPAFARAEWQDPQLRELGEANRMKIVRALHEAGAKIMVGTDTEGAATTLIPGAHLYSELELYVEAGMTPYEALRTATVVPAEFLGRSAVLGTVEEGKRADLVLLEADPLESIDNARQRVGVMVRGKWLSTSEP